MLRLLIRPLLPITPSLSLRFKQGFALSSRKMATAATPDFVRTIFEPSHVLYFNPSFTVAEQGSVCSFGTD
jgi:hypothetical protein